MSDCKHYQADFNDYRDNQLDQQRHQQIAKHLSGCPVCRRHIEQSVTIEQYIRDEADTWTVPEHLWARIKASADDSTDSPEKRLKPQSWMAAAVLVCALVIVAINVSEIGNVNPTDTVASALVSEFHTFVISGRRLDYVDTRPVAIRQWFGNKVDFRVPMPVQAERLSLAGGRLCNMLDQRVASYMYQSGDAWVSLYIMKATSEESSQKKSREGIGKDLMHQGYGYIDWEREGLRYSLVGDIPIAQLRRIAKSFYSTQASTEWLKLNLSGVIPSWASVNRNIKHPQKITRETI